MLLLIVIHHHTHTHTYLTNTTTSIFPPPQHAKTAVEVLQNYKFDKSHTLTVTSLERAKELSTVSVAAEFQAPEPEPFNEPPRAVAWMEDPNQRDEFVVRFGTETIVSWWDAKEGTCTSQNHKSISEDACYHHYRYCRIMQCVLWPSSLTPCTHQYTSLFVTIHLGSKPTVDYDGSREKEAGVVWCEYYCHWSPQGNYLATLVPARGVILWSGPNYEKVRATFSEASY